MYFQSANEEAESVVNSRAASTQITSVQAGAATATAIASRPSVEHIHDAAQQSAILRSVLEDDKQRIGCFLGAGCPLGIYDEAGTKSIVLIPAVDELTKRVARDLEVVDSATGSTSQFKKQWDLLVNECKSDPKEAPTVEDILSEIRALTNRKGASKVLGMDKIALVALDSRICISIASQMQRTLPTYRCSYNRFASWVGGAYRRWPIEVFTPNYDLLFEQAFEGHPLPHFDGFIGSREPWFDLSSIEHDSIPERWTRLWKLHGSLNWERREDAGDGTVLTRVVRVTGQAKEGKAMIFPSHLKYDQSRRMPYLAMLDRLKSFFQLKGENRRIDRTEQEEDAPRLIICGYSFSDDHLNEVLLDGLRGNRNAQCFALMYGDLGDHTTAVRYAEKQGNLTLIARDGAVVGTRAGLFRPHASHPQRSDAWIVEEDFGDTGNGTKRVHCLLGDFHYFGLFLEQLCGVRNNDGDRLL